MIKLSKNEKEIMKLLWEQNIPLLKSEIVEMTPDKSWKPRSIHILLNSLLDKGAIKVEGMRPTGKNYGRTFIAAITQDDYVQMELSSKFEGESIASENIPGVFLSLMNNPDIDRNTIDELQAILELKREI